VVNVEALGRIWQHAADRAPAVLSLDHRVVIGGDHPVHAAKVLVAVLHRVLLIGLPVLRSALITAEIPPLTR
jgi:hypothetical protein